MTEQITLLDVCKLPDVQIHSKSGLFKYLVNRQNGEMLKLRENIVRLSYTNKIIGIRGDEVGIISKRLPLKFTSREQMGKKSVGKDINQYFLQDNGFIAHQNFYVQPLPTLKKSNSQVKIVQGKFQSRLVNAKIQPNFNNKNTITLDTQNGIILYQQENYKPTTSFRSRTQSMARLKVYQKKQSKKDTQIKFKAQSSRHDERKKKSFSSLLKGIKTDRIGKDMVAPILHEQNNLFKRYQRLSQKQASRMKTNQNQNKKYSDKMLQDRTKNRKINQGNQVLKLKNNQQQILVEADD